MALGLEPPVGRPPAVRQMGVPGVGAAKDVGTNTSGPSEEGPDAPYWLIVGDLR
jgi:hypothetical protein